jgi:hypothetical protein
MHRAIALLTATAFLSAGCAARSAPPRDPTRLTSADVSTQPPPAPSPPPAGELAPLEPEGGKSAPDDARASDAMPRAMGWVSLSFGVTAGIVALGTSIMMLHENNLRSADCNAAKVCSQDGLNANSQISALATWNAASYVAAGVGIGVGAILLLTSPASSNKTALEVTPVSSGGGLQLRGTF